MERVSLTMANRSLQMVTARATGLLMAEPLVSWISETTRRRMRSSEMRFCIVFICSITGRGRLKLSQYVISHWKKCFKKSICWNLCLSWDQFLWFSLHIQLTFSSAANSLEILNLLAETFQTLRPRSPFQVNLLLSPQQLLIQTTIQAGIDLWFRMVRFRSASKPPLGKLLKLVAILSAAMSKAFPVPRVTFSSLGVWSMLSYPKNQREPSAESSLKTLTVPLGRAIPSLLVLVLEIYILLPALRFLWEQPPEPTLMKLYFLTLMPQTLGMNSTCFWEFYSRETVQLRVYMWKSEKDFSEKEGGASATAPAPEDLAIISILGAGLLLLTMLTSPAISLSLAPWYLFPLLLSMVTHPPTSAFFYLAPKITEQSAFHLKPVVLQATSQSVVTGFQLKTFQLRVGTVLKPAGREGKVTPSTFQYTSIPLLVFRMKPLLQPRRVPLILLESCPNLTKTSISLLMNFLRMAWVLTKLASQFCSNTLILSGLLTALKVTVSVQMLEETSVKQRSLLPWSKEISLTSLTMAKRSLQTVTARDLAPLISEAWRRVSKRANRRSLVIINIESRDIHWFLNYMKTSAQEKEYLFTLQLIRDRKVKEGWNRKSMGVDHLDLGAWQRWHSVLRAQLMLLHLKQRQSSGPGTQFLKAPPPPPRRSSLSLSLGLDQWHFLHQSLKSKFKKLHLGQFHSLW